jgi:DNA-directed RNA polymerase subunit RPC12/RpoP
MLNNGKGVYRSDEKHPAWKGDHAKRSAMHHWVVKYKGKASLYKCIDCGKQAKVWSNKDHLYKRILKDYEPRCTRCHGQYDKVLRKNNNKL